MLPHSIIVLFAVAIRLLFLIGVATFNQDNKILYVRSSEDQRCPCHDCPCYSLSEYLANYSHLLVSNTTLKFLTGKHIVNGSRLENGYPTFSNVTNFTIVGHINRGKPVVSIQCTVPARFIFSTISQLSISNLEFIGCGQSSAYIQQEEEGCFAARAALEFNTIFNLMLDNVHIRESSGWGLVGINVLGRFTVRSCLFFNNSFVECRQDIFAGGNILLCYLQSNRYAGHDNLVIEHSELSLGRNFLWNAADRPYHGKGGGLSLFIGFKSKINVFISNCTFYSNIANMGAHIFILIGYRYLHLTTSDDIHDDIAPSADYDTDDVISEKSIKIIDCSFISGLSERGGVYYLHKMRTNWDSFYPANWDILSLHNCTFSKHYSYSYGGALLLHYTDEEEIYFYDTEYLSPTMLLINVTKCTFFSNIANNGGALYFHFTQIRILYRYIAPVSLLINRSNFIDNVAVMKGGHVFLDCRSKETVISHSRFQNGTAGKQGGGVYIELPLFKWPTRTAELFLVFFECLFISNQAHSGGGVSLHYELSLKDDTDKSTGKMIIIIFTKSQFTGNIAEESGGGVSIHTNLPEQNSGYQDLQKLVVRVNECHFARNSARYGGGLALHMYSHTMHNFDTEIFIAYSNFTYNSAEEGSALHILGCGNPFNFRCFYCLSQYHLKIHLSGTFSFNSATPWSSSGSTVKTVGVHLLQISDAYFLSNIGCSIHAGQTKILVKGQIVFDNNTAHTGGAFFLNCDVNFSHGAIALITQDMRCVLRSLLSRIHLSNNAHIEIRNNHVLFYGGGIAVSEKCDEELRRKLCFFEPENVSQFVNYEELPAYVYMENNTAAYSGNSVYGGMLELCYWRVGNVFDYVVVHMNVFRSIFVIKDANLSIKDVTTDPYRVCFCEQETITSLSYCTMEINKYVFQGQQFNVSAIAVGTITKMLDEFVRASLPSEIAELEPRQNVQLLARHCSELTYTIRTIEKKVNLDLYIDCISIQKHKLISTINVHFLPCPIGFNLSGDPPQCDCAPHIRRELPTLVCDINSQTLQIQNGSWIGNFSGNLIGYPHCPFDYCIKQHTLKPSIPDASCAMNRSGVLCGECRDGYSLALGSGHCLQCSNIYLLLLLPIIAAGVLLVLFIKVCNLTVSKGTINGLILYANIIQVKKIIFFPQTSSVFTKALIIIIAWLNLDLGIETCFLAGMNEYIKAWLQFAFPVFIWGLVGLVVLCSRYSLTLSRLIGRNAVQVLATLFLLSYAKLLRTVFAAVSPIRIVDRYGTSHLLWLMDGNVPFLRWPHIFLFLFAVFATFFYIIPLMLLTALAPYLQARSDRRLLRWVTKMKPLLDAYTGPYRDNHRYWTGLMLLLRIILFITFSANATGDPAVDLLAIIITIVCVSLWQRFAGRLYKNYINSMLEAFYLYNITIFTAVTMFLKEVQASAEIQEYVACFFVGVALIATPLAIMWQFHVRLWQQLKKRIFKIIVFFHDKNETISEINPTVSEVEIPQIRHPENIDPSQLREPLLSESYFQ